MRALKRGGAVETRRPAPLRATPVTVSRAPRRACVLRAAMLLNEAMLRNDVS